jgi:hypothetical protein
LKHTCSLKVQSLPVHAIIRPEQNHADPKAIITHIMPNEKQSHPTTKQNAIHKKSISLFYHSKPIHGIIKSLIPQREPKKVQNKSMNKIKIANDPATSTEKSILHQRMHSDIIYNNIKYISAYRADEPERKKSVANKNECFKYTNPYSNDSKLSDKLLNKTSIGSITKYNGKFTTKYNTYMKNAKIVMPERPTTHERNSVANIKRGQSLNDTSKKHTFIKDSFDKDTHISNYSTERQSSLQPADQKNNQAKPFENSFNLKNINVKLNYSIGKRVEKLPNNSKAFKPTPNSNMTMPATISASPIRKLSFINKNILANPSYNAGSHIEQKRKVDDQITDGISEFYQVGKILGSGAFGKVFLGYHKLSNKNVAIKTIKKEFLEDKNNMDKLMREVTILKSLSHPSIVQFYEQFETHSYLCLVLELCAGGDLLTYVRKRKRLNEDQAKFMFRQIIEGILCCHENNILHRDIKLDNILFNSNGLIKVKK